MDCLICSSFPPIIRPPRNTICAACYEGIKNAMTLVSTTSESNTDSRNEGKSKCDRPVTPPANLGKGVARLPVMLKLMKDTEEELAEKTNFLAGSLLAFRDRIHTDIQIKPGNGPPISAHRAILASRSEIFRNMLDTDPCKSPPNETVSIPELTHEELESLMEFLYSGSLAQEKVEKHVYCLSLAGDKYEIPYLQKYCERQMLGSLSTSSALDVLEVSDSCSNQKLKETAMEFIVGHVKEIAFTAKFEAFCFKSPHLAVQIMRACLVNG